MTPHTYAEALQRSTAWTALRWIDQALRESDFARGAARSIRCEQQFGSPADATIIFSNSGALLRTDDANLEMEASFNSTTLRGQPTLERVTVDVRFAGAADTPEAELAETLRQLLRCIGIPPRRDFVHVLFALDSLETSLMLGWEVADEMRERLPEGQPLSQTHWIEIAKLTQEIEDLAGLHHKACTQALNNENDAEPHEAWWENEDGAPSRLDQLEQRIQQIINDRCTRLGLSPMLATFNRDPRGLTVRLVGRESRGQWKGQLAYRGREFVLGYHPLRTLTHGLVPSAQALWSELQPLKANIVRDAHSDLAPGAERKGNADTLAKTPRPSLAKAALDKAAEAAKSTTRSKRDTGTRKANSATAAPLAPESSEAVVPTTTCPADVLQILRNGAWSLRGTTDVFELPPGQLDRKLYERVRDFVAAAEGKWVTKLKGFSFQPGGADRMRAALIAGVIVDPKDVGFFPTPTQEAEHLAAILDLRPGMKVFEPSAGRGALALAAAAIVGKENVICAELLPHNAAHLRSLGFTVHEGDFLQMAPEQMGMGLFPRIIMNPPFGRGADLKHIQHACRFLQTDGRLAAILSPGFQFHGSAAAKEFREMVAAAGDVHKDLEAGTFKESGTMVRSVVITLDADRLLERMKAVDGPAAAEPGTACDTSTGTAANRRDQASNEPLMDADFDADAIAAEPRMVQRLR